MCWQKIMKLFSKEEGPSPSSPAKRRSPRKWWEFPFRVINTHRGGMNMPKTQPCPECRAKAKRGAKTLGGANYLCRCGTRFFVKAPERAVGWGVRRQAEKMLQESGKVR